jgi:hypothetical protein
MEPCIASPQPISNAPRDRIILTDLGTARYVESARWTVPVIHGWFLTTTDGHIPRCAEQGWKISRIEPTWWMPMSEFTPPKHQI